MRLVLLRTGAVLALRVQRATSTRARLRGLLGRDALPEGEALAIEPCSSIHTFFMRFPIDVVFLARDGTVVRALSSVPPWRITRIYPSAALAVELPSGTLARAQLREGDALAFTASPGQVS